MATGITNQTTDGGSWLMEKKQNYTLTTKQMQLLTERVLDEKYGNEYHDSSTRVYRSSYNRTFTTYEDQGKLTEKLVEKDVFDCFLFYVGNQNIDDRPDDVPDFIAWLMTNPRRFCWLVAKFMER
jgi:hypothetical protein